MPSTEKGKSVKTELPLVAIILPAYNEEREIESAISQMVNQSYSNREIIVVDDGSSDGTFEKAFSFAAGKTGIRVIKTSHGGPSYARNLGVKESSGDIVFFGECDCVYDSDYLEKAVKALDNNVKAGAVCLTGAPLKLKSTLATDCIELENILQHVLLESGKIKPFYAWVFWREAFNRVGGYDEKLFQAEDRDLFARVVKAGYEIAWVPGIHWRHKRVETLNELSLKWFRRGRTRVLYSVKNRIFSDLAKTFVPFWALALGVILAFIFPFVGFAIILLVLLLFLYQTARVARVVSSRVKSKRAFLEYLVFLMTRNFSTAVGYTYGALKIMLRKMQRKTVTYREV